MNDVLGDTILDKLRLNYTKKEVSQEVRDASSIRLKELFPTATVNSKAGYIQNTFNPAKLIDLERSIDNEHNLQRIPEERLAEALRNVFPVQMREEVTSSIFHIAVDYILKNPIEDYMCMLSNIDNPYITGATVESDVSVSLYLHFAQGIESEETPHFRLKFYDKGAEYCKRHDNPICKLYESLTEREIELLGEAYNHDNHSVDMSMVNMLRIELELVQKDKLIPIIKRLDSTADKLTLNMILRALDNNSLYGVLREVFHEKLRKYIFTAYDTLDNVAEENNLSIIRKNACRLQLEDNHSKHFTALMIELGYKESITTMNRLVRKIVPDSDLYTELYSAIFSNDNSVITEEPTEELIATTPDSTDVDSTARIVIVSKENVTSHDLNSSDIKNFMRIYEVPILDDS